MDPFYWLTTATRTKDEQDKNNPYKPFPNKRYLWEILQVLFNEPAVFIEKSRTMMCSWLISAYCAYIMFTRPAQGIVIQSEDEDRAIHDINYIKCLWENSIDPLKRRWPLTKELDKQPYYRLDMKNGSWAAGIPGNPDKIRSLHPSIVCLDEAAHIEHGDESYNVAVATRCTQIIALSSAKPGWFRNFTEFAPPVDWPMYGRPRQRGGQHSYRGKMVPMPGLSFRRTKTDIAVVRCHYTADPDTATPEWKAKQQGRYSSRNWWDLEMEIRYEAMSGQLIYPEFQSEVHVIPDEDIPKRGCRFMGIDPHPRTPHAFAWVLIDKFEDWYLYRETWPSVVCGQAHNLTDDVDDMHYSIIEYCEMIAEREGNFLEFRNVETDDEYAIYRRNPEGRCPRCERSSSVDNPNCYRHGGPEHIIERFMDTAGKGFVASGEHQREETYSDRYYRYGIVCNDPIKSHKTGEDAVHQLLMPRRHDLKGVWPRLHIAASCVETELEFKRLRYQKTTRYDEDKELKQEGVESRRHLLDILRYMACARLRYNPRLES